MTALTIAPVRARRADFDRVPLSRVVRVELLGL